MEAKLPRKRRPGYSAGGPSARGRGRSGGLRACVGAFRCRCCLVPAFTLVIAMTRRLTHLAPRYLPCCCSMGNSNKADPLSPGLRPHRMGDRFDAHSRAIGGRRDLHLGAHALGDSAGDLGTLSRSRSSAQLKKRCRGGGGASVEPRSASAGTAGHETYGVSGGWG